jgi:ABC-type antimicrobial peptide transport system permease subunit
MALGAAPGTVQRMVVVQGVRVVLIGLSVGLAAATVSTRALGTLLYGVGSVDPVVFLAMSLMLVAIGMLASFLPARRASRVDPIESLRSD